MAWTDPRTWVAGEKPPAATLNTHIRDNFKAIGDAWTAFGSGANWTGTGSNPSLGNGTWDGKYIAAGKLIVFEAVITAGSTTTFGSGTYGLTLPVAPLRTSSRQLFTGTFFDTSASGTYPLFGILLSSAITFRVLPTTAGNALAAHTPTVPVTMANGDAIEISGVYEAA